MIFTIFTIYDGAIFFHLKKAEMLFFYSTYSTNSYQLIINKLKRVIYSTLLYLTLPK